MSGDTAASIPGDAKDQEAGSAHDQAGHHEHYDPVANKIGMWLFLFTEVLLFGTLFIAFAVYLTKYHFHFVEGSEELDKQIGAINTVILLTSSLSMALAIAALSRGRKWLCQGLLTFTLICAAAFMVIKSHEWAHKFDHGIYPRSADLLSRHHGEQVFFGMYFAMTGLHAAHVLIGGGVIILAMVQIARNKIRAERVLFLENVGLYWHLVDMIWIFLFPLFYLL